MDVQKIIADIKAGRLDSDKLLVCLSSYSEDIAWSYYGDIDEDEFNAMYGAPERDDDKLKQLIDAGVLVLEAGYATASEVVE